MRLWPFGRGTDGGFVSTKGNGAYDSDAQSTYKRRARASSNSQSASKSRLDLDGAALQKDIVDGLIECPGIGAFEKEGVREVLDLIVQRWGWANGSEIDTGKRPSGKE